ncbi:ferredoxin [Actinokineospora inagensis]|uniref:ferredoxin n=1 Tax=Actinokineospora inagensis TaxID=103730 RepID=UPI0004789940|nr:ferredoxin [Actinokineospora inagensis]
MRVEIDHDVCVGAGQCAASAPEVFDQGDTDGLVRLLRQPAAADQAAVREAVWLCPSGAVRVVED